MCCRAPHHRVRLARRSPRHETAAADHPVGTAPGPARHRPEELGLIDDLSFVHPKDMQDGLVEITENDITTNLPYVAGAHLVFDHHLSETVRNGEYANHVIDPEADSAHYSLEEILALPDVAERAALHRARAALHAEQLRRCTPVVGEVAVLDLRAEPVIHAGNRFMIDALFPEATVSIHLMRGKARRATVAAVLAELDGSSVPA